MITKTIYINIQYRFMSKIPDLNRYKRKALPNDFGLRRNAE